MQPNSQKQLQILQFTIKKPRSFNSFKKRINSNIDLNKLDLRYFVNVTNKYGKCTIELIETMIQNGFNLNICNSIFFYGKSVDVNKWLYQQFVHKGDILTKLERKADNVYRGKLEDKLIDRAIQNDFFGELLIA